MTDSTVDGLFRSNGGDTDDEVEPAIEPDIEVWNRATSGTAYSWLAGDVALAHALRLDGDAAAGSLLAALEAEVGEGTVGAGRAGFAWFGLEQVVRLIDEAREQLDALSASELEGSELDDRYEEIDRDVSDRYAELDVADGALSVALKEALMARPGDFAETTGVPDASLDLSTDRPKDVDELQHGGWATSSPTAPAPQDRPPFARDITAEEKIRRSAQALAAFGITSWVDDGRLQVVIEADEDWDVFDAVIDLIDRRYPPT